MLDDLITSEFNNIGELYGLEGLNEVLASMPEHEQRKALLRMSTQVKNSRRSRQEMEKFFREVPQHIRMELIKGRLRLSDYTLYSTKIVSSKTIKMFEPQDDKEIAIRNVANAKLPKNNVFLVSGIYLLAGGSAQPLEPEATKAIEFESIINQPAVANGEFSLKANRRQIIPENQANRRFITDNDHTVPLGYYKLDNPRLIKDEELIEFTVELGTMIGLPTSLYLWVGLDGTGTAP